MHSIQINGVAAFESDGKGSILESALASKAFLPYSCKTGRCNTCKCRVLKGETRPLFPETGLSEAEIADGWILSCVRSAVSDLELACTAVPTVPLPEVKILPCRIHALNLVAPDVLQVFLRLPPNVHLDYLPGQHLEVIGAEGLTRVYSIANAPGNSLELHIRRVADGQMSRYWFETAKPNDLLRIRGPMGTFFLREISGYDLVFFATGTGIAPIKAILEQYLKNNSGDTARTVTVFWGGRTERDLYFDPSALDPAIRYVPVLSRATPDWQGCRGYVQEAFMREHPDLTRALVYACGGDAMIKSARDRLLRAGLPEGRFFSDAFVPTN